MSMNSQDFMDKHNERAEVVRKLIAYCDVHDYSYKFTEKEFKIQLPKVEPLPVKNQIITKNKELPNWSLDEDANGLGELPEELPPVDGTLNEGETPEETK